MKIIDNLLFEELIRSKQLSFDWLSNDEGKNIV